MGKTHNKIWLEGQNKKKTGGRCDEHNERNGKLEETKTLASQSSRVGVKRKIGEAASKEKVQGGKNQLWIS